MSIQKIDIRPGVSVLGILQHLNYKPWFALGEFVDNSIQSFITHRDKLTALHGKDFKLKVFIDIDPNLPKISIRDNAAGIFQKDYPRAFRPAAVPPDRSGLCEFGMGMKSAACWFSPNWTVRTKALGEGVSRVVSFDIANIIKDDIHELDIKEVKEEPNNHYTEIVLDKLFHPPVKRTIGKLKEHLTDIYRVFIRQDILELRFNGDLLKYSDPKVLETTYFKDKEGARKRWSKPIEFDFGNGLSVHGFAAIRETGDTARAGFALFRRGRLIQGSGDEGYRPDTIFGSTNSYRYQRIFGELHLDGFDVSHTKDGFRWDENEQPFLDLLREHLDDGDLPLLKQAEGYRAREQRNNLLALAKEAVTETTDVMQERLPEVLPTVIDAGTVDTPSKEAPSQPTLAGKEFKVSFRERDWVIKVEVTYDPSESQWLVLSDTGYGNDQPRCIGIRVSMTHPFMVRFAQANSKDLEAILRIAAALALAEVLAHDVGVKKVGTIRRNVNDILKDVFSEA